MQFLVHSFPRPNVWQARLVILSGRITVLLWSPVEKGSLKLLRKARPSLLTQERLLHWLQMLRKTASSNWQILTKRSMVAFEMRPSSPHQVDLQKTQRTCASTLCVWLLLSLISESDVPHDVLVCESLHLRWDGGSSDGHAHTPNDGAGRHPRPRGTGLYLFQLKVAIY